LGLGNRLTSNGILVILVCFMISDITEHPVKVIAVTGWDDTGRNKPQSFT